VCLTLCYNVTGTAKNRQKGPVAPTSNCAQIHAKHYVSGIDVYGSAMFFRILTFDKNEWRVTAFL